MKTKILLVDDDREFVEKAKEALSGKYEVVEAYSEAEFREKFRPYEYDIVLLDMRLEKEKEGLGVLREIIKENPDLPVIMITGYADVESAVEAMKVGAVDYIKKENIDFQTLGRIVGATLKENRLRKRIIHLEKQFEKIEPYEIIGKSKQIEEVKEKIRIAAADGNITVLIRGESGVGKELVARNVHRLGIRKDGPYITVLLAGLHKESVYSDLFGHEKGAFTGAVDTRRGFIEDAHKGILFLDEIGDLDRESQIKLLRVIENKTFTRLGGNKEISVDVQFVTATNKKLEDLMEKGIIREDLYYRLKAFEIIVPPLRERKEDIPLLIEYFIKKMHEAERSTAMNIEPEVIEVMMRYEWKGNIRELKNVVEFACIQANTKNASTINMNHIPSHFFGGANNVVRGFQPPLQKEVDIQKNLACEELNLLKNALEKYGKKKYVLAEKLGYSDRFTFARRIRRIFSKFPEMKEAYPEIAEMFGRMGN